MRLLPSILALLIALAFGVVTAYAQVLNSPPHVGVEQVPLGDDVYPFLRHLSVRGLISGYSEAELPLSEYEVAEFLRHAKEANLSNSEAEQVEKYLRTFGHDPADAVTMFPSSDAQPLFTGGIFTDKDKYLYRWSDDSTNSDLFVHGLGSAEFRHESDPSSASVALLNLGGNFSGTLSGHVGLFLQGTDGTYLGDSSLALKDPVLSKNRDLVYFSKTFFDFTSGEFAYNYDWFTGKIAREALSIGGGYEDDNILLSPNVPTYDFVSLEGHVKAVRYSAIFASLFQDSATPGNSYPQKFMSMHDLTFNPSPAVELGFTDMVIFSDRVVLDYLSPFSFLKTVEHDVNDSDRDNVLFGTHLAWHVTPGFEIRGQGLVDDIVFSRIGTGYWSNKWAWQFGAMWAGAFGISDLDLEGEWIRVEPYTYSHGEPDNPYSIDGSVLGAQIGPNSMSYWTKLRWTPNAKWIFSLEAQLIERGENLYDSSGRLLYNAGGDYTISMDSLGAPDNTHFLEGRRVNIFNITADAEYEPWRGITLYLRGTKKSVDYLNDAPMTPGFNLNPSAISKAPLELPATIIAFGIEALI